MKARNFASPLFRLARSLAASGCVALLAACTSVINPYVSPEKEKELCLPRSNDLTVAIQCADAWKDVYRKALGDRASLRNVGGVGLIALASGALGHGITAESPGDTLSWLGVGGAAGYGTLNWLDSRPAEHGYVLGAQAMSCAIDSVQPLAAIPDDFDTRVTVLPGRIKALQNRLIDIKRQLQSNGSSGEEIGKDADVVQAQATLDSAFEIHGAATTLATQRRGAAQALLNAVRRITGQVDSVVNQSQRDVQAISDIIGGLSGIVGINTNLHKALQTADSAADPVTLQSSPGDNPVDDLRHALSIAVLELKIDLQPVAAVVEAVQAASYKESLKACSIDEKKLTQALQIKNPPESISADSGGNISLIIQGGLPPYTAELLEAPVDGVAVSQPVPFGSRISVAVEAGAPPNTYSIYVRDAAGRDLSVPLRVSGSAEGRTQTQNEITCPHDLERDDFEKTMGEKDVFIVQRSINVEVDGIIGSNTRLGICEAQKRKNMKVTARVDKVLLELFRAENSGSRAIVEYAKNPYERSQSLTARIVREIQGKLGLAEQNGMLDAPTRAAIAAEAAAPEPKGFTPEGENGDELNAEIVAKIRAS